IEKIIERADGVPLFIEELTKAVLESGARGGNESVLASVPSPTIGIPATLHASLMARLDRLGPAKELAQIGATIGREFTYELLAKVAEIPEPILNKALRQLVGSALVFERGIPPTAKYTFKHALVQDAAYASLLKSRRAGLHERIANALQENMPDIADAEPEILAHHPSEAGLPGKAIAFWLRAGKYAAARSANLEAIAHVRRGIAVASRLPPGATTDRIELDLHLVLGPCLMATQGPTAAAAVA